MNTNMVDIPPDEVGTDDPLPTDGAPDVRLGRSLVPLHTPERILRAPLAVVLFVDLIMWYDLIWLFHNS